MEEVRENGRMEQRNLSGQRMNYTEAIKSGFRIVNKNWQLVLIQVCAMGASFISFFVVVGVPLAIAFIVFGLDLTELSRIQDALRTFKEPTEILSKYFALVVLVLASLLLYILIVLVIGIFLLGGSMGVIGRWLKGEQDKFRMKVFMAEGKQRFFPLTGFTTLVGLLFVAVAFILGLFGGAIAAIVSVAREQEATLALFLGIFFSMILFVVGMVLIFITLSITIYGAAIITLRGTGPLQSLKESIRYLYRSPEGLYFYCVIFCGYIAISFFILFLSYPIGSLPLIGPLIALVYHFCLYIMQSYLGLVMIAVVFWYYQRTTGALKEPPGLPLPLTTAEGYTPEIHTSEPQAPGQDDIPQERDQSREG
jgi:hypothetical protein